MEPRPRVLVVDDSRAVVHIIEALLEKEGYEVATAFDGVEGLQKARDEKPDLIILDIVMPKMDGYEVCRILQDDPDTAAIPVLILTVMGQFDEGGEPGDGLDSRLQEQLAGLEAGAMDFVNKPIKAKDLLERVRALLWFESFPNGMLASDER
jgi:two-component system cell cycle response regulator